MALSESTFKEALDDLSMIAQYFRYIVHQGVDFARQISFLVEKFQDAVFSESHRCAPEALTAKMEVDVAKQLAKLRLEKTGKKGRGGAGAAQEGCVPQERKPQWV